MLDSLAVHLPFSLPLNQTRERQGPQRLKCLSCLQAQTEIYRFKKKSIKTSLSGNSNTTNEKKNSNKNLQR